MTKQEPSIDDVRSYWERFPLLSHEVGEVSPMGHWTRLDEAKRTDIERFTQSYWDFSASKGKSLLDIGCGPGWLTVTYAAAGARVSAIDLTSTAIKITTGVLQAKSLTADLKVGSAENLPYGDGSFEIVVSSGVLHHTPNTEKCFNEAFRVTKPGGIGRITLYRLGILHKPFVFPVVRAIMRVTRTAHPGADLANSARTVEEFVRQYDGADNPIGVARTNRQWREALEQSGWVVKSVESHYFPLRMMPRLRVLPRWMHWVLDRYFGTMVYFTLVKPVVNQ